MKKPFQGCDDKHAPICARWHAARAAMDAADRRNDAIAAAATEAGPRLGVTVARATLRYGARAVQQLGNGNVRYIF